MRVGLMIEGQEDVDWHQWQAIAAAAEAARLDGLFRSDHYGSVVGADRRGGYDAWTTLAALGAVTGRIRLGTLVSPVTFRHPALLAKAVVTADHVSGGRVELGIGAGWHEAEHRHWGFEFPPLGERMERLQEQLDIVVAMWTRDSVDFDGRHYHIEALHALPRPLQRPRPPVIVGGRGGPRSIGLAAAFADEYNTVSASPEECRSRRRALTDACRERGRAPDTIRLSVMTTAIVGRDATEVSDRASAAAAVLRVDDPQQLVSREAARGVVGTLDAAAARLQDYHDAGVERIMLRNTLHRDLDAIALMGELQTEVNR